MKDGLKVIKNTSVLFLGRIITTVLGIVYVAALSRYVQPSGLGMIATATAVASLANLLLNFGLYDVTVRDIAVDRSRAVTYIPNLFFLRGVLAVIFFIVVIAIARGVNYPPATLAILFIYCLAYIFDELSFICFSIFNAHERMEFSAALQTGRDLLNICLSLAAIMFNASLYVIVGISAFASLLKLCVSLAVMKWKFVLPKFRVDLNFSYRLARSALPFAALILVSVLTQSSGVFILSLFRPAREVGWYSSASLLVQYLLLMPTMLIQAVFPVFSRLNVSAQEELRKTYSVTYKYLLLLGFAMCAGVIVVARPFIMLYYGSEYEQAIPILQISAFVLFWIFGFANGSLLNATGGQGISAKFAMAGLILMLCTSLLLIPSLGPLGAALARILPGALFFIPLTVICHKRLDLPIPYGLAFKSLTAALIMAGTASLALANHVPLLAVILALAPAVYVFVLVLLGVLGRADYRMVLQMFQDRKSGDQRKSRLPNERV